MLERLGMSEGQDHEGFAAPEPNPASPEAAPSPVEKSPPSVRRGSSSPSDLEAGPGEAAASPSDEDASRGGAISASGPGTASTGGSDAAVRGGRAAANGPERSSSEPTGTSSSDTVIARMTVPVAAKTRPPQLPPARLEADGDDLPLVDPDATISSDPTEAAWFDDAGAAPARGEVPKGDGPGLPDERGTPLAPGAVDGGELIPKGEAAGPSDASPWSGDVTVVEASPSGRALSTESWTDDETELDISPVRRAPEAASSAADELGARTALEGSSGKAGDVERAPSAPGDASRRGPDDPPVGDVLRDGGRSSSLTEPTEADFPLASSSVGLVAPFTGVAQLGRAATASLPKEPPDEPPEEPMTAFDASPLEAADSVSEDLATLSEASEEVSYPPRASGQTNTATSDSFARQRVEQARVRVTVEALPPLPPVGEPHPEGPFAPVSSEEAARWHEVIDAYEREARALGGGAESALVHLEIGRIYEEKLGMPPAAASAYQTAFNLSPADPAVLYAARRLFMRVGNWPQAVQIIGFEIEHERSRETRATLRAEQGLILENKRRDFERAEKAYESALEEWSAEPLAIGALERLHVFEKRHEALFRVYERALEVETQPERRLALLLEAAHLAEDRLDDPGRAVELLQAALDIDPVHPGVLAALRRLHRQSGDNEALVAVLERSADVVSGGEAAQYLLAAARVANHPLDRPEEALRLLSKGLDRAPTAHRLLREAEILYLRLGRTREAIDVLRREAEATADREEQAAVLQRLAQALEAEGDFSGAADAARAALARVPGHRPAIQALGRALEALDRPEELAALYLEEIEDEPDPRERVGRLFKLAEIREVRLGDAEGAIAALRSILVLERDFQPARKRLEHLLLRKEAFADLVALHEEEVDLTADAELQVFLLGRIGVLAEEKLGDLERAKRAMRRLLELAPRHLGAIRTLARIAERDGDDEELLRLLELEAEATGDQLEVLALLHRRAQLLAERRQDTETAGEVLERVLTLNPTYLPALRSLGRIRAAQGRWRELLDMHLRELDATRNPRHRVDLLYRIARVREERLGDLDGAVAAYEALLSEAPDDVAARRSLADLYARAGSADLLARLLSDEAEREEDPARKAELLLEIAELSEERLDRADQAAELYQQVLKLGYRVDAATRALIRIYSREGMWNALVGALRLAAERIDDPANRAEVLVRAAQVHADKLKSQDAAADLLERALDLAPGDRALLEQLERVSIARRDWGRALEVGERLAELEPDPRSRAARRIRLASLEETQLDPPRSGGEHYRRALEAVPGHPVALRALEAAYFAARDFRGLAAVHLHEASVAASAGHRAGLLVRAAEIFEERLQDRAEAARLYDSALEADPGQLPALRGRRRIAEAEGDLDRAIELLGLEAERTRDPQRSAETYFELGRLLQDQVGDVEGAIQAYERMLALEPSSLSAFNRLEAILLEREDYPRLQALLRARSTAVEATEEQARLLVSAGQIAEERLSDRAAAMADYQAALEREPKSGTALVRLYPLLMAEQAWKEAIDVLHRILAVSKESTVLRDAFKALGVIYQEHKTDLVKSVQSFQAALQADPSDTESLYRLAELYRGARDWVSAINVLLRLAEVEPDPTGKTAALLELSSLYIEGSNDEVSAIRALRKAVEIDRACRPALERLCELHEAREEWPELVEAAGAFVNLLSPKERSLATPLHLRMAEVFERRLGDDHRAINALRYVLEDRPKDPVALQRLSALYGKRVETYPQAVEAHRRLLALDPFRVESYHELHRMFERLRQHDRAFVAAEILVFLQAQTPEELVYYRENRAFVAEMSERALTYEQHHQWVLHPDERGVIRPVMELLAPELGRAFVGSHDRLEGKREQKLGPKTPTPVRALVDELSALFEVSSYELWLGPADDTGLYVESERPPALVVGGRFSQRVPAKDQRFLMGRAMERIKGGHLILDASTDRELEALLWAAARLSSPNRQVPADPAALEAATRKLVKNLSSRTRRALEEVGEHLSSHPFDVARYRAAAVHTANRAGLVASNDIETAVRVAVRGRPNVRTAFTGAEDAREALGSIPEARELLVFAMSEAYLEARQTLGFSVER